MLAAPPGSVTSWGWSLHKDEGRFRRAATGTMNWLGSPEQEMEDGILVDTPARSELAHQASDPSYSSTVFPVQHQRSSHAESTLPSHSSSGQCSPCAVAQNHPGD